MKSNNIILTILAGGMLLAAIILVVIAYRIKDSTVKSGPVVKKDNFISEYQKSDFERGKIEMENKWYVSASNFFKNVKSKDSNFAEAQRLIVECNKKQKEIEAANKKEIAAKQKIQAKYERLMKSGLHLYQIEERLQRDNFYMVKSEFEKAPDGSDGVRQYFTKNIDGFTVDIWLQNAYSLSYYYTDVKVY